MANEECGYCQHFRTSPHRKVVNLTRNLVEVLRRCPNSNRFMWSTDIGCPKFIPADWFYCLKDTNWVPFYACPSKQRKGHCSRSCFQGKQIKSIIRGYEKRKKKVLINRIPPKHKLLIKKKVLLRRN